MGIYVKKVNFALRVFLKYCNRAEGPGVRPNLGVLALSAAMRLQVAVGLH